MANLTLPTEDEPVVLIHGDGRSIMQTIDHEAVGAVVTDPPWGIGYKSNHNSNQNGEWAKWRRDENFQGITGDNEPFDPSPWLRFPKLAFFGANYFSSRLPDSRCWVTWDKRMGVAPDSFADCEYVWTNCDKPSRIFRHLWKGLIRDGEENVARQHKLHPHQKPLALIRWLLDYMEVPKGAIVFDPYTGSGSVPVACAQTGRRCVAVEIDSAYYGVARKRIDEVLGVGGLYDPAKLANV